jgi:hypothetical protein
VTTHLDAIDLATLNKLWSKYRAAVLGWTNLATCVASAMDKLADGKQGVAYHILEAALQSFSPPDHG